MTYVAATADKLSSGRSISLSGKTALVIAAIAFASGASAWIAGIDPIAWVSISPSNRPIDAPLGQMARHPLEGCISVFERHAEGVAIAPNQSTLADAAKIIEGQFKVRR
jgi:hypothetical protein